MSQPVFGNYPIESPITLEDCTRHLEQIEFERKNDIQVIQNLPQIFALGRKVGRVPSGANDIQNGDKVGDFNIVVGYAYYLISDGMGGALWARIPNETVW